MSSVFCLLGLLAIIVTGLLYFDSSSAFKFRVQQQIANSNVYGWLQHALTSGQQSSIHDEQDRGDQIIYVMGGRQADLLIRLEKAAQIFHSVKDAKLITYIEPGITEYDRLLGRNLTNREWAEKILNKYNIPLNSHEFATFQEGFLGTLSECRNLYEYAQSHNYTHVRIVTSTYHTRRVQLTFSSLAKNSNMFLSVHAAGDVEILRLLLKEYFKLLFYRGVLFISMS